MVAFGCSLLAGLQASYIRGRSFCLYQYIFRFIVEIRSNDSYDLFFIIFTVTSFARDNNWLDMQSDDELSSSTHGVTRVKGKDFTFTWSIHNLNSLFMDDDVIIESPKFYTNVGEKICWSLKLSPNTNDANYLTITLYIHSSHLVDCKKKAHLTLSIVDYKGKEATSFRSSFFPKGHSFEGRRFLNFIKKDCISNDENGLLLNGTLTIKCKMFFLDTIEASPSLPLQNSKSCNCNLKDLFKTKKLSDIILHVGDEKFESHKCILAAQSKVFSAMFEHSMKEKKDNTVEIDDIEPQVIQEMLQYIYGEKTDKFQDVSNLLIAADKYGIDELKKRCESQLIGDMNAENIGEILILADCYNADTLKKHAIQFINTHSKRINFEKFKKDIGPHSPLLIDMLRNLIQR